MSRLMRLLIALVLVAVAASRASAGAPPRVHHVAIDGATFAPASLTIALGDSIVWTNKDPYPHTVTSDDGQFDSKQIATGKTFRLQAVKKGEYHYTCMLHQTMHGSFTVK